MSLSQTYMYIVTSNVFIKGTVLNKTLLDTIVLLFMLEFMLNSAKVAFSALLLLLLLLLLLVVVVVVMVVFAIMRLTVC